MPSERNCMKLVLAVITLFLIIPVSGCASSASVGVLSIYAAAGAKPAIDELCREFGERYGTVMEVTYGGGGEMLSQIELARTGDIYIAPEQRFMESAVRKGLIDPATLRSVAYMVPVIAVCKGNPRQISCLSDLTRPGIRVAITRPETTLLGKYAPEIFEKAGLTDEVEKNIVTHALRPDSLLTMLILDQVDAGIIWHFYQIESPEEIEIIWLRPEQLTGIGEIQIAVTTFSNDVKSARKFIDFVTSTESKTILEKHGYIVDINEVKEIASDQGY